MRCDITRGAILLDLRVGTLLEEEEEEEELTATEKNPKVYCTRNYASTVLKNRKCACLHFMHVLHFKVLQFEVVHFQRPTGPYSSLLPKRRIGHPVGLCEIFSILGIALAFNRSL